VVFDAGKFSGLAGCKACFAGKTRVGGFLLARTAANFPENVRIRKTVRTPRGMQGEKFHVEAKKTDGSPLQFGMTHVARHRKKNG